DQGRRDERFGDPGRDEDGEFGGTALVLHQLGRRRGVQIEHQASRSAMTSSEMLAGFPSGSGSRSSTVPGTAAGTSRPAAIQRSIVGLPVTVGGGGVRKATTWPRSVMGSDSPAFTRRSTAVVC